jgi:hypothetical protein
MCGALLLLSLVIRRRHLLTFGAPNRLLARMIAFVTIFVCVWVWPLVLRAHEILTDGSYNHALVMVHSIMISGQGFGNFCVWITSPAFNDFFAKLRHICPRCCCSSCCNDRQPHSIIHPTPIFAVLSIIVNILMVSM